MTERQKRDIRAWLRLWPQELFIARALNSRYHELGPRVEGPRPAVPGRGQSDWDVPRVLDEVEVIDRIGSRDERAIYYLIDQQNSTVSSARWIEPDNPRDSIDDPNAATEEVRIDYGGWRRFSGLLMPTVLTRWIAGKADTRIAISDVIVNEPVPDRVFQDPAR